MQKPNYPAIRRVVTGHDQNGVAQVMHDGPASNGKYTGPGSVSTLKLRAGDVMVQRGTNHAWLKRGSERARVAFVLVDAQPLAIGHALARGVSASEPGSDASR